MVIRVYDYDNRPKAISFPNKDILEIFVCVLSGDETGHITFTDGTQIRFDASDNRIQDFFDGCYTVKGQNIKKWIDFKYDRGLIIAYQRRESFGGEVE